MHADAIDKLARAGLNLIQQALSIFDSDLRLAVCNLRYQEMFGLPDHLVTPGAEFEETIRFLVGRGEYGPQSNPDEAVRIRVEAARAFAPHYMERQRANGRWISVEGAPLPQGGWVTVYTDITEIKFQERLLRARSEELSDQVLTHAERLSQANRELAATNTALEEAKRELTEIEARTRLTTEMMPAHIAHVDRRLVYTYSNRRLSTIMPGRPQEIVGQHALDALGPSTFSKIGPHMRRALAGEANICELTHEDSGRRIRVALTPEPETKDAQGRVSGGGIYILSTDITEETQARAALMQTRKRELAAQLTSGLAHDFANLLTIILGLQGRLLRLGDLPEPIHEIARATVGAARRGGALLERIGSISGRRSLRLEPTEIEVLLDDLQMMARPSLPDPMRLVIQVAPGLGEVLIDAGAVQDCLLNLILNARDALASVAGRRETSDGTILVQVRRVQDTWLEFVVEDDGPGFSALALERAMDPFFTTKGSGGSGLGLAMVYDQISLAGGSVRLSNIDPHGARIVLRLPLRRAGQSDPARLVLLVEDDPEIRTEVREMLCALGQQVIEADTAQDALALARIEELSLVLSDVHLGGAMTGVDLLAQIARDRPGLAMGLMTSLPRQDPLYLRARADWPVISKPFDAQELAQFLQTCDLRGQDAKSQALNMTLT